MTKAVSKEGIIIDESQPLAARMLAHFFSYVFHPVFIPVYICWFLLWQHPYIFSGIGAADKIMLLIRFAVMYILFPMVTIALLKGLGFIESIQLKTQKDRIIPYIACGVYYFWMWYVFRNQPQIPDELVKLSFAIFIASSAGLMANIYMKISMHGIGAGVMLAFIMLLGLTQTVNLNVYIAIALLIAGVVCTSRLIVSDHSQKEVYGGLLLGIVCQAASWYIM